MTHSTIYVGNTHLLRVDELKDEDGADVNNANVTLQSLTDKDGAAVTGVTTPLTLSFVSTGRYEVEIPYGAGFTAGQWYEADVLAIDSSNRRGRWTERMRARVRTA